MEDDPEIPELTDEDLASAIRVSVRKRLMAGIFEKGSDVTALQKFVRLSREQFIEVLQVPTEVVDEWEAGHGVPVGPALQLLRLAAWKPSAFRHLLTKPKPAGPKDPEA